MMLDDDAWGDIFGGPRPVFQKAEIKKKPTKMSAESAEKFFKSKKEERKRKEKEKKDKELKKKLDEEGGYRSLHG